MFMSDYCHHRAAHRKVSLVGFQDAYGGARDHQNSHGVTWSNDQLLFFDYTLCIISQVQNAHK